MKSSQKVFHTPDNKKATGFWCVLMYPTRLKPKALHTTQITRNKNHYYLIMGYVMKSVTVTGELFGSYPPFLSRRFYFRKLRAERDTLICRGRIIEGYCAKEDCLYVKLSGGIALEVYCDNSVVEWKVTDTSKCSAVFKSFDDVREEDLKITLILPSIVEQAGSGKSLSSFVFNKADAIRRMGYGTVRLVSVMEYWFFIAVDDYEYMFSSVRRFDNGEQLLFYGES